MHDTDAGDSACHNESNYGDGIESSFGGKLKKRFRRQLEEQRVDSELSEKLVEFIGDLSLDLMSLRACFRAKSDEVNND